MVKKENSKKEVPDQHTDDKTKSKKEDEKERSEKEEEKLLKTDKTPFPQLSRKLLPKVKKNVTNSLIPMEETLRDRWFIKGMIGHGGYGEIYLAIDMRQAEEVAIKVEPKKRRGKVAKRMILEQKVLLRLQGRPHVPKMVASGNEHKLNWIIMQLLSVNLGDLKKGSPSKHLSKSTVGRIMQQGIAGLRDVHTCRYLHRDVKPANMCFGITPTSRHILMLVDFGLVRKFKNSDGSIRPARRKAGFRGTLRYVSIRVHNRLEQCPADDLVSMLYSGIELLAGDLPWKFMSKADEIRRAKEELQSNDPQSFMSRMVDPFQEFARAIVSLGWDDEPNYTALIGLLSDLVGDKRLSDPYDWENEYKDALDTSISDSERQK